MAQNHNKVKKKLKETEDTEKAGETLSADLEDKGEDTDTQNRKHGT